MPSNEKVAFNAISADLLGGLTSHSSVYNIMNEKKTIIDKKEEKKTTTNNSVKKNTQIIIFLMNDNETNNRSRSVFKQAVILTRPLFRYFRSAI